jgi:hypothetical protein
LSLAEPSFDLDLKEFKKPSAPVNTKLKAAPQKKEKAPVKPLAVAPVQKSKPVSKSLVKTVSPPTKTPVVAAAPQKAKTVAVPIQTPPPANLHHSTHKVISGDTLYGILIHNYELTKEAASLLIPSILLQNKLENANTLTAGHLLTIPLSLPEKQINTAIKAESKNVTYNKNTVVLDARTACPLAKQILAVLAEKTTAAELFPGVIMPGNITAVKADGISAILVCGMSRSDEYTFKRLLEIKDIQLISLSNDDGLKQVVQTISEALGFSFQLISEKDQVYQFRRDGEKDYFIRISEKAGR